MKVLGLFAAAACAALLSVTSASAAPIVGTQSFGIADVFANSPSAPLATQFQFGGVRIIGGTQDFAPTSPETLQASDLLIGPGSGLFPGPALGAPFLLGLGSEWGLFTGTFLISDSASPVSGFLGPRPVLLSPIGNSTVPLLPFDLVSNVTSRSITIGGVFEPGGTGFGPNNATFEIDFDETPRAGIVVTRALLRTSGAAALPVPEPGTLALLALGFGTAAFARRRR